MKQICVVTHTEATHHVESKVGGWYDSSLTARGLSQAASLAASITAAEFPLHAARVISSDLKRCRQTAVAICTDLNKTIVFDKRLREMSFGEHEGWNQLDHHAHRQPISPDGNRLDHRICPGAESRREVALRANAFMQEIVTITQPALVVTHGFCGSFIIAAFQAIDINSMGYLDYKLSPGSITLLEIDDVFQNRSVRMLNT